MLYNAIVDIYAEQILDHFRHPRGKSPLSSFSVNHEEKNTSCGDYLTLQLQIDDGKITNIGWSGEGCAISQAGMSLLHEEVVGMNVSDVDMFDQKKMNELLGVPIGPRRVKCALLSLHALKNALRIYAKKEPQSWVETLGNT